jgi:hypothetical protein
MAGALGMLVLALLLVTPRLLPAACNDAAAVAAARAVVASRCDCAGAASHKAYVKCAARVAKEQARKGALSRRCRGAVKRCAESSTCGRRRAVVCCGASARRNSGVAGCSIKKDAASCVAKGGCVANATTCCDACGGSCTPAPSPVPESCGNGTRDIGEQCDGGDLNGATCPSAPETAPICGANCRLDYSPCTCPAEASLDTLRIIDERIFSLRGCAVSTCHGAFAQSGLDLRPGSAHANLVDVLASNPAARAAGKRRVVPGNLAASFLSQKLHGTLAAGEGDRMPLVGRHLSGLELDLIDAWITAGAPASGRVAAAPCLPPEQYEAVAAPPVPPGGYQIVLDGPILQPGEELEGCLWVQVPNTSDFMVGRWEFSLNPGTHHFAIMEYKRAGVPPQLGEWITTDPGCFFSSGATNIFEFGVNISGSPQAPTYVDAYPPGVARILPGGSYVGLNAHYANVYDVPIQIKVWSNLFPYQGAPSHIVESLISLDTTFAINVPPFQQKVLRGRFVNRKGQPLAVIQVVGHMHKRGLRFTAWRSDGSLLYENTNWSHPLQRHLDPPLVLQPGDWIDYECLHDNGQTRPVRRDQAGNPTALLFGVTTEDEMCIITGQYYLQ